MQIDLYQLIEALSDTIDLVGIDELHHGKRVACMAVLCGKELGCNPDDLELIYHSALLHDCGVSSTQVHKNLVNELEWEGADHHCLLGAERMDRFAPFRPMSGIIRYHHTPWHKLKTSNQDQKTRVFANLIFLVDRVDAMVAQAQGPNILSTAASVLKKLESFRTHYFQSGLVDVFLSISKHEAFWIGLESCNLADQLHRLHPKYNSVKIEGDELYTAATLFADIVDAKSSYTAEHSRGVAQLGYFLAERCSLSQRQCDHIKVAGLLHDLGKLQVPDNVLDLAGPLDPEELSIMHHHSYVTYQILQKIPGFENISLWAANHHEKLDGTGYPFGRTANELSLESRIIIIADIFQALAQNRPYRNSLQPEAILSLLDKDARKGQLDREIIQLVRENVTDCYQIAIQPT